MRITIDSSLARIDLQRAHNWLKETYWAKGITREKMEKGFRASTLVVGAYLNATGAMIGIARCISDTTRFGYIADVYVDKDYRGHGIAGRIVKHLMDCPTVRQTEYWYLLTKDAQPVYAKLGFELFDKPERFMKLARKKPRKR